MTTKPTPASQPSPEFCTGCWKRVAECRCASAEQPSPARSDKEAERAKCAECGGWSDSTAELHNAGCSVLAERAPSGEGIATWNERGDYAPDIKPHTRVERFMQDEINDLRAALARRATAGTTAAPERNR